VCDRDRDDLCMFLARFFVPISRRKSMSFQHFRLGTLAMSQPLPPHLQHGHSQFSQNPHSTAASATTTTIVTPPSVTKPSSSRPPYGSGDSDDGYTLVFPSLDAFQEWRAREEETQMVEFVKGDTHGSKAIPPRFKDHTKLVCARHSRSGRKKYVKKHPERVRKVPSRKVSTFCSAALVDDPYRFEARRTGVSSIHQLQDLL